MVTWPLCLPLSLQWSAEAAQPASGKEVGSHLTDELWLSLSPDQWAAFTSSFPEAAPQGLRVPQEHRR